MEKLKTILEKKEAHFHTISPDATVAEALNQMCCENNDYLVVVNDDEEYLGLLTEHDIASKAIYPNKPLSKFFVRDLMNVSLPFASTSDSIESGMKLMQQFHIRHLPVFDDYYFKGILSAFDIIDYAVFKRNEIFDSEEDILKFS